MAATTTDVMPYVVIARDRWGDNTYHFLAVDATDARTQFDARNLDLEVIAVRPATPDDAPWTVDRCSPTDDPAWWRVDEPCDYDLGESRTCHHPVHAFAEPGPLRHLIEADLAATAARYGWWS